MGYSKSLGDAIDRARKADEAVKLREHDVEVAEQNALKAREALKTAKGEAASAETMLAAEMREALGLEAGK